MSTVTVELTLEQLIDAFLKLSPEDELRVLQALCRGDKGPLSQDVMRLVEELRAEREKNLGAAVRAIDDDDYAEDDELTVFMSLDAKDFHA